MQPFRKYNKRICNLKDLRDRSPRPIYRRLRFCRPPVPAFCLSIDVATSVTNYNRQGCSTLWFFRLYLRRFHNRRSSLTYQFSVDALIHPILDANNNYIGRYKYQYSDVMDYLPFYKDGYWKDEQQPYEYGVGGIDPRPIVDGAKFLGTAFTCRTDGEHWFHGFGPDECKEEPNYSNDAAPQIVSRNVVKTKIGNRYLLEFECFMIPHWLGYTTWRSCKVETMDRALSGTHRILCPESDAEPKEFRGLLINPGVDVYCDDKPSRVVGMHDLVYTPTQSLQGVWSDTGSAQSTIYQTILIDRYQCLDFVAGTWQS